MAKVEVTREDPFYSGKNRQTGTTTAIRRRYDRDENTPAGKRAGLTYEVVCLDHKTVVQTETRRQAFVLVVAPQGWCEKCAASGTAAYAGSAPAVASNGAEASAKAKRIAADIRQARTAEGKAADGAEGQSLAVEGGFPTVVALLSSGRAVARCEPCGYEGKPQAKEAQARAQAKRHVKTAAHAEKVKLQAAAPASAVL